MKKIRKQIKSVVDNQNNKDILSKSFGFLVFRGMGIIGGYLFTYLIANRYGASMNGLVTLGFAIFMFASAVSTFGVDINLVKYYSDEERWKKDPGLFYKVLLKAFLLSVIVTILLYIFRDLIVLRLFKKPQLLSVYNWAIFAIPSWTMVKAIAGVLRGKGLNNWYAFFINTGKFSLAALILIAFDFLNIDPLNAIKAHFYATTVLAVLAFVIAFRNFKRITIHAISDSWQFMKESFPMFISTTITVFLGWIDSFVLGIYVSDSEIGVYNVAIKIALGASFAMEAINSGLAPKIARLYFEKKEVELKKLVHFSTLLNFGITISIVAVLIFFNQWLLGLFGEEFKAGFSVLLILSLVHLLNSFMGSAAIIMQMIGYQKQYQNIAVLALVLNLGLNFLLVPQYGTIGAAVSTAFSLTVWYICNAVFLKRKENIITYFNPFIKVK